jgi:glycosyltransferase involved in cell wall biosynthesis
MDKKKISKISVIIASYNSESTIENAIISCLSQKNVNLELIIIDGKSLDGTCKIINNYKDRIDFFVSENDKGIYEAWNKGLSKSTGDWVCFLGSDDSWSDKYSIYKMLCLKSKETNFISGIAQVVNKSSVISEVLGRKFNKKFLKKNIGIAHSGSLHKKILFEKFGNFDENFKISGDYDFLIRCSQFIESEFLNEIVVIMLDGGISRKKPFQSFYEGFIALKKNKNFGFFVALKFFININIKFIIKKIINLK